MGKGEEKMSIYLLTVLIANVGVNLTILFSSLFQSCFLPVYVFFFNFCVGRYAS